MFYIIFLITILFASTALLSTQSGNADQSLLSSYFTLQLHMVIKYALILSPILVISFIFYQLRRKKDHTKRFSFFLAFEVIVIGFLMSFVFLLCIAFLQLNIFSVVLQSNPKLLGVENDRSKIITSLKKDVRPPEIITTDTDPSNIIVTITQATSGRNTFYSNYILSSIPSFLIIPVNNTPSIMSFADMLIVTKINNQDIEAISPSLAYLFTKQYFPNRYINSYPKVSIMNKQDYVAYRKNEANKKLIQVNESISRVNDMISTLSAGIKTDEKNIVHNKTLVSDLSKQRESQYSKCVNTGTYRNGIFYRSYTKEYCKNQISQLENKVAQANKTLELSTLQLQKDQAKLEDYNYYKEVYSSQKNIIQVSKSNVSYELGIFEPKDAIKIDLNTTNSHKIADYFATLVHEYYHYASYVSADKKLNDSFFEEGLTEYFTRMTIKDSLHTSTNLGYPVTARVISQMMKRIPESDFADIYFSKDQERLETVLDRAYEEDFYRKNQVLFLTLQYTSDPKQALKLANMIMKNIGGNILTEKDLMSSYSSK